MGIPFLKNFRRGFATNSSSSHSFVYMKSKGDLGPEDPSSSVGNEFGWQDFTLSTIREKLFYVLVGKIGGGWGSSSDASEEYELYGDDFPELSREDFEAAKQGYVDHESVGIISEFEARDPHVVVFGGNDNDGRSLNREEAIRNGEVDWEKTAIQYSDSLEHIPDGPKKQEYLKEHPWHGE